MIIILDPMFYIILYYIYMIIINFLIEACFLGYIRALCNFMSNYLYNIYYIRIRDLFDVFRDLRIILFTLCSRIFLFFDVFFGLTKKVWDFGQGFKNNIIRP